MPDPSPSSPSPSVPCERIVADAPDAIVAHDLENRVLSWNPAAEKLYGWSEEEILGQPVGRIFYLDTAAREEALQKLRDADEWSGELRQIDREGNEHLVRSRQRLLRDGDGAAYAVLAYNTDVTQLRKAEDAEARAHHVRSSSLLAGGIAHELNNALAPIMLSSAMLKRSLEEPKLKNMVAMIEKCANRGSDLIADLLAFERGRSGGTDVLRRTQVERALKRAVAEKVPENVKTELDIAEDLWEFRGDMEQLGQVFGHVMQNACEAMAQGGSLRVEVNNRLFDENFEQLAPEAKAGAYVSFVFTDTGHGIEQGLINRVAEPFFTTKEPRQGFGFGLANSQAIIKGHRGFMVLDSAPGDGTTLSFFLPAEADVESMKGSAPPFPIRSEGNGMLVLVADDEFFIRETIKKTLEERGYTVITAQDGTEALAVYASRMSEIDLVVTNVEMPFMDGPALCRALKRLDPDAKILVSSGYKQPEKVEEMRNTGVRHFLSKPYTADNLADSVQALLADRSGSAE